MLEEEALKLRFNFIILIMIDTNCIFIRRKLNTLAVFTFSISFSLALSLFAENTLDIFAQGVDQAINNSNDMIETINLRNTSGHLIHPIITGSGNNVYVAWEEKEEKRPSGIYFKRSIDNGTTFSNSIIFPLNSSVSVGDLKMFASGNNVSIMWNNGISVKWEDGIPEINYRLTVSKSIDGGVHFSKPVDLLKKYGISNTQEISSSENYIYVLWENQTSDQKGRLMLSKSIDGGVNFTKPVDLKYTTSESTDVFRMAISDNNLYILGKQINYLKQGKDALFLLKSYDGGVKFPDSWLILINDSRIIAPEIIANDKNVYIIWKTGDFEQNQKLNFIKSINGGIDFDDPIILSYGHSSFHQLKVFEDNVYVIWSDDKRYFINNVFFKKSTDGGNTFDKTILLSNNKFYTISDDPQLDVYKKNISVIWNLLDYTHLNIDDDVTSSILFTKSYDGGSQFSDNMLLSENNQRIGDYNVITSGDLIYIVWTFTKLGHNQINGGLNLSIIK